MKETIKKNNIMKKLLFRCLFYLRLHKFMRYLYRKKIIVLMYHGFTDKKIHEGIENYQGKHLNVEQFGSQIKYLKKYYNVISLNQLIKHCGSGIRIPNNSVVITMDDGYKSSYTLAYPILKQYNIPATIFLTTNFINNNQFLWTDRIEYAINVSKPTSFTLKIDNEILSINLHDNNSKRMYDTKIRLKLKSTFQELKQEIIENLEHKLGQKLSINNDIPEIYRPLEWHEVLKMIRSGIISIGSHTCTHSVLTRCSSENMKKELFLSKQLIEKKTELSCKLFCYPVGKIWTFDYRTKTLLKELDYSCGLTTVLGMNDESSDVFELKRLGIKNNGDLIEFIMILSGVLKFFVDIKQSILNILKKRRIINV